MKVGINQTVEMTDEQRVLLADLNDGKVSRRMAKRDEAKVFVWQHGENWDMALETTWSEAFAETVPDTGNDDPVDDEDLLGTDLEDLL